jgi:hypothetical protein
MRFIHTFNSKPLLKEKFNKYETILDVILTDYAYSAACCKKHGYDIILYTDKLGAKMLSHIGYNEVIILDLPDEGHFAASIKFEAIKNMTEDDILIDGDLFIQNKKAFEIIESYKNYDFVYSFYEPNRFVLLDDKKLNMYKDMFNVFIKNKSVFKKPFELIKSYSELEWPNTSLMRFNNLELKNKYLEQYMYHLQKLVNIDFGRTWPDIIIEQFHMKRLLEYGNYTSKPIIENYPNDESNKFALEIGFTHLGNVKINYNEHFKQKLKLLDSDLYNKVQNQIEKYKSLISK